MQFFISHLARLLRTRRFSEPTFGPSAATNHWKKHSESRLFYLFAHLHLLSSDSFSSLIFSLLLFSFLTLPISAFPFVHIVGRLTSKLFDKLQRYLACIWISDLAGMRVSRGMSQNDVITYENAHMNSNVRKKHGRNMSMCAMVKTCVGFPCWQKCMYCTIHMRP